MLLGPQGQVVSSERPSPSIPEELAVLPSPEAVLFPYMLLPLPVTDQRLVRMVDDVVAGERKILAVFTLKEPEKGPILENLYRTGTAAGIARMLRMPDGGVQILLQGLARIALEDIISSDPYIKAKVRPLQEQVEKTLELEALARNAVALFQRVVSLAPNLPDELGVVIANIPEPGQQADFIASHIKLSTLERQEILETLDVAERLRKVLTYLNRELEILELSSRIQSQVKGELDKAQREFFLRKQLEQIKKELGEEDEHTAEINQLRQQLEEAGLPEEAKKEALRELDRMAKMPPQAAEYTVARSYLDWLISLPWNESTEDNLDVDRAAKILDEDHYGLEKPKERILEYLAVRKIKADMKGPILCFVGPPGTGKTSLGRSIARALGRKFVRVSLGGVRDEAEIRGHRRTYVGALPGRIIQGIRRAGSNNPVFMLDEIDKLGADFRGDPSAALLEVLDPEQNNAFVDHYLDVPFDLSRVMFITTANVLYTIPPALLDRMEVLELPGYTEPEKVEIAKRFLIPRQLKEHGLEDGQLRIEDGALRKIIRNYTREAGVRNLEREIAAVCRKAARKMVQGEGDSIVVGEEDLHDYLGPIKFRYEVAEEGDEVGVATGLAWTPTGGEVLFVEAAVVPGKGNLILTGQMGDVMQESAKAALTYIRSRAGVLEIDGEFYRKWDMHIHVPSGAVPKDGPSAGVTMTVALISALTRRPARKDVAMTGEITLRGRV
ncbi:MAG: endopeptidase La, partial [Candidatus Latescibacterota bacterium]